RGETQVLATITLGTTDDEQIVDTMFQNTMRKFMLHYNFPPFSVGETGRMGGQSRREIGHGALAERSIKAMMPLYEKFPYTVRIVCETLESNGSSSMGSVCSTSMALMDAGVPYPKPVAGIAMGLIKEGDRAAVLTDILGDEDHLGDMDFKVAGTKDGITGIQIDINDDGKINIATNDAAAAQKAIDIIKGIVQEVEVGKTYKGVVKKIVDFGAFVSVLPNQDGLLDISEIAHERVNVVTDYMKE